MKNSNFFRFSSPHIPVTSLLYSRLRCTLHFSFLLAIVQQTGYKFVSILTPLKRLFRCWYNARIVFLLYRLFLVVLFILVTSYMWEFQINILRIGCCKTWIFCTRTYYCGIMLKYKQACFKIRNVIKNCRTKIIHSQII